MSVSISTSSMVNSTYSSGQTRVSGLVSDFDFDAIIDATLQAESVHKTSLEEELAEQESYITSLEELGDYLDALETSLGNLDSLNDFSAKQATSNNDALTVSADASAANGYHEIEVGQIAQNAVVVNTGTSFSDSSTSVASTSTTFSFSYNSTDVTLDIPSGTTLEGLVDLVNADSDSRDLVEAYLINDGDGYYFAMSGQDMGEDYTITLNDSGTTLTGFDDTNFSSTRTAQNAQLKIDGFPTGTDEWIERTTNDIDDVITGLTLNLEDVTDGVARINVSTDTETISENITSFVDDVNVILQYLQIMTGTIDDPSGDESTIYVDSSNYTLGAMYQSLKDDLSSRGTGFTDYDADSNTGDVFSYLSQVGIYTDTEEGSSTFGLLLIDDDALEAALDDDPDAVAMLFAAEDECTVDSSDLTFLSLIEGTTEPGDYDIEYEISGGVLISASVNGEEARVSGSDSTITITSGDGKGLYFQVNGDTDGSYTSGAHVKAGKIQELIDSLNGMTNTYDGTLQTLTDSVEDSFDSTSEQIDSETSRLEDIETRLIDKYSTLQASLAYYAELQESLDSMITSLES